MAKANTETVRLRPNTIDENRAVLLEVQSRKLVDSRKQDELNALFDRINADCASKSLQERRKALASSDKLCEISKPAHYGPYPGVSSGKRWGNRMDCSKDCIHELFDKNVHNGPYGAVSICTSHLNDHNDVDLGNFLTFTSRVYSATDQAKDSLILNYKNQVPLRLVRSYNLSNDFAPKTGYRYDGLYTVVDYWVGVSFDQSKHRKFALVRVTDQEVPPWNDVESKCIRKKEVALSRSTKRPRSLNSPKLEPKRLVHTRIHKLSKEDSLSAIESKQVFNENIDELIISSSNGVTYQDPENQNPHLVICAPSLCSANISIGASLHNFPKQCNKSDVKKAVADTFDEMFKQQVLSSQQNMQDETEAMSIIVEIPYIEDTSLSNSSGDEYSDECSKKVTWADVTHPISCDIDEANSHNGNDLQVKGSDLDRISPKAMKSCEVLKFNSVMQASPPRTYTNKADSKNPQHVVRIHSNTNAPQTSKAISSKSNPFHEVAKQNDSLYSIDSLAPDKLVSVVFKDKHHPMAKLIVGNMIGLENQESEILSAYHELSSNHDAQESSKKSKENKLRSKFLLKNRSRKNGILSNKHRREIANLMIDAKFDTARGSRASRLRTSRIRIHKSESLQRKLVVSRRIPSSSKIINKDIRNSMRTIQTIRSDDKRMDEMTGAKRPKMVSKSIQCSSLVMPSVDQSTQVDDSQSRVSRQDKKIKFDCTNAEETRVECSITKKLTTSRSSDYSHYKNSGRSAFAPVNTLGSSERIAQLRSIGFKPIGTCSPIEYDSPATESPLTKVDEEYSKYTSEDSDVVSYMHEHLHFEDIEDEDVTAVQKRSEPNKKAEPQSLDDLFSKPVETLTERDFDEPWHGWKRVSVNGKSYWTGY